MVLVGRRRWAWGVAAMFTVVAVWPWMVVGSAAPAAVDRDGSAAATHELLGTRLSEDGTARTELLRTTLPVGAAMPPTLFAGDWLVRADEGVLTVTLLDGSAVIGEVEGIALVPGVTVNLGEGRVLLAGPDAAMRWENRDDERVRVLSVASVSGDQTTMTVAPDGPEGPAITGPVLARHVVSGTSLSGDRSRITVADRSGRVIGARVPSERELRFAGPGRPSSDSSAVSIGPVASLDGDAWEVLLRWTGTPCGPVVTVDVAHDVSAIRIVDRTPGCDAMAVGYALVLRFRGPVPDVADIDLRWVRRR